MKENNSQYRIDRYVRDEMSDAEKEELMQDMKEDDALAADMEFTQDVMRSITDLEQKKRLMAEWEEELASDNANSKKIAMGNWVKNKIPMLVALAACFVFCIFLIQSIPEKVSVDVPVVRGDATSEQISRLVENEEYEDALSLIDEILADSLIDESLPMEEQEYMRAEYEENRKLWEPVRKKLSEKIK